MSSVPPTGSAAPDFTLPGWYDGRTSDYRLSDQRGRPVVLVFYPGDETMVCTKQLCAYSDDLDRLTDLGATVWAISPQDLASHERFATHRGLRLPLLADVDRAVASAYGVNRALMIKRSVFVVDPAGHVAWAHVAPLGLTFRSVEEIAAALAGIPSDR